MRPDDDAFRAYVEAHRGELMRTAVLLAAGDRWAAEDLVQTALTRLYVVWSRVRPGGAHRYARRCLLNALIDHRRLSATRRERLGAVLPETPVRDRAPIEMQSAVFGALARLPARMRAAVVMRHLLDLSVEETADALNCRPGTVKSQTARGLDHLRIALEAEGITVGPDPPPAAHADPTTLRAALGVPPADDLIDA